MITLTVTPLLPLLDKGMSARLVDLVLTCLQKDGYPTIFQDGSALVIRGWAVKNALSHFIGAVSTAERIEPDQLYIVGVDPLGLDYDETEDYDEEFEGDTVIEPEIG